MVLQSYLFVGFPVVLNTLAAWRSRVPEVAGSAADPDPEDRVARGEALCRTVYGRGYGRLRDHVRALHPDLDRWMIEEGYGKTLTRPGLSVTERELSVVALLAAAGHRPQLRAHARGAMNVGASFAEVERAIEIGIEVGAPEDAAGIRAAWIEVKQRLEKNACSSISSESE